MGVSYLHGGSINSTRWVRPPCLTLSSMLRVHRCSVSPLHVTFSVPLLKAFYDLSLCFPLVRSGRKGRRRVFSLSEADSHGGHWV